MKIIDTHAHYDDGQFDIDRYSLLDNILKDKVQAIINIGCSLKTSRFSVELSEKYPMIFAAVGVHPEYADNPGENYIEELRQLAANPKVKAIGEIGLDYHYEGYNRDNQIKLFKEQLMLAKELCLPVVIHSRDATEDTLNVMREIRPEKAVFHCFSGSAETAKIILDMGYYISFTGVLTFKNSKKAVQACEIIPTDRLMTETDCPYMAPVPHRGKRCDSSMTIFTAEKMAEIKGLTSEEMIEVCNKNAIEFFNLSF